MLPFDVLDMLASVMAKPYKCMRTGLHIHRSNEHTTNNPPTMASNITDPILRDPQQPITHSPEIVGEAFNCIKAEARGALHKHQKEPEDLGNVLFHLPFFNHCCHPGLRNSLHQCCVHEGWWQGSRGTAPTTTVLVIPVILTLAFPIPLAVDTTIVAAHLTRARGHWQARCWA